MTGIPVWEDGAWPGLPPLDRDLRTGTCVVGLGGSGLAAVLELLRLGEEVVGIDAGIVGGGAAGRNGGFLLAGLAEFHHDAVERYGREWSARCYRHTIAERDRMSAETPTAIRRPGSLRIATDPAEVEDCERQRRAMVADGLPVEWYEGPEGSGLLIPDDGVFDPLKRCRLLAQAALAGGARLFGRTSARAISSDLVETSSGRIECRGVVVAVDGGLAKVLPELDGRVRDVRLQMLATAPTDEVELSRPVYARYGYDFWQQLPSGAIVLGGWRDRTLETEFTDEAVITPEVQQGLDGILRHRIGVTAPVTHRWVGIVGYTPDGLPVVEEVRPGVWAIGGYCGTGNVVGAMCGRAVAQGLVNGASELLDLLRSDRRRT